MEFLIERNREIIASIVLLLSVLTISYGFEQGQTLKGEVSTKTFEIEKEHSIKGPIIKEKLPLNSENVTVNATIKSLYGKEFSTRILTAEEKRQILLGNWVYYVPPSRRGREENNYHLTFPGTKENLKKGYFLETTHRRLWVGRDVIKSKVFSTYKRKLSLGQSVIFRFTNRIPTRFHTFLAFLTILGPISAILFRFEF